MWGRVSDGLGRNHGESDTDHDSHDKVEDDAKVVKKETTFLRK